MANAFVVPPLFEELDGGGVRLPAEGRGLQSWRCLGVTCSSVVSLPPMESSMRESSDAADAARDVSLTARPEVRRTTLGAVEFTAKAVGKVPEAPVPWIGRRVKGSCCPAT